MGFFDKYQEAPPVAASPPPGGRSFRSAMTGQDGRQPNDPTTGQGFNERGPVAPGGGGNSWDGLTGAALAQNPDYIRSEITRGFQQRYGRPPTPQEMQQWEGYAAYDVYGDGKARSGWNPYLWDRLVTPGSEGASGVDPGQDTVVPMRGGVSNGTYQVGQFSGGGPYTLSNTMGSGLGASWTTPFTAPELNDSTDPGYQARFKLGADALQGSAFARGTGLTGGFMKDLNSFAQDYASNEYDKIYGRRFGEYNNAYNIWRNNQGDLFNRLSSMSSMGLNAANGMGGASNTYGNNMTDLTTGVGNAQAAATGARQNAFNTGANAAANFGQALAARYTGTRPRQGAVPRNENDGYDPSSPTT